MDFYRSLSDTADRPAIATPAVIERKVHNLKAAPLTDVMYEQLEYLIGLSPTRVLRTIASIPRRELKLRTNGSRCR